MIIHLIGSARHLDEDLPLLQAIREILQKHDIHLAHDWVTAVHSRKQRKTTHENQLDWQEIVHSNIEAISTADALIIEGSRFNYSQAYQTALALQLNKPVLNLYRKDLLEYTEWPDKFFVSGIDSPFFHNVAYKNQADLTKIVKDFIDATTPKMVEIDTKITLDQHSLRYVEMLSDKTGRGASSVIRDIITREASRSSSRLQK
jgi:hypothetical protein